MTTDKLTSDAPTLTPSRPTPGEEELVRTLRQMDTRLFGYRSLLRATRALHYCRDVPRLMTLLRAIIRDRLNALGIWVFLYDEATRRFVLQAEEGEDSRRGQDSAGPADGGQEFSFALQPGILWQLMCEGGAFSVVGMDGAFRFPELFAATGLDRFAATHWLPLAMENRPVGLVALGPLASGRPYGDLDEEFLNTVGEQATVAIASAFVWRRLEEGKARLGLTIRNLDVLYEISRASNQIDDMKKLLLEILDKAIKRVGAGKGSIMLYNAEQDLLRLQVVRGLPDKRAEDEINHGERECTTFRPGEGVAGTVFQTGKVYLSNNTGKDTTYQHAEGSNVTSIVCLPLMADEEPIGVLNMTNKKESRFDDEDIEILEAIASQAAVTIRRADLYHLAVTDELTQLYVRRYLHRRIEEELNRRRRYGIAVSLLMMDIDHFKKFNDTYGHDVGDEVLKLVARALAAQARDVDVVARHGGEEFAVLLPETGAEGAARAGERFRAAIEAQVLGHDGEELKVTVSVGVAGAGDRTDTCAALLRAADTALYQAKSRGRNRVVVHEPGMELPNKG